MRITLVYSAKVPEKFQIPLSAAQSVDWLSLQVILVSLFVTKSMKVVKLILKQIRIWGIDWFVPALLLMILMAWIWPEMGLETGVFSLKSLAGAGISVIFFLYGLRLSYKQVFSCISHWKLHLLIQTITFVVFPLMALALRNAFPGEHYRLLWLGCFFLATLPSTVSSAVVMVSLAGGNVPAAIFNASFSSIAGLFISPLWMGVVLNSGVHDFEMTPVILKLGYQILLPMLAGVMLHQWFGKTAIRYAGFTRYFDQSVILTIVYTSFSASFGAGLFSGFSLPELLLLCLVLLIAFALVMGLITLVAAKLNLSLPDRIAALFCGSTKSLMHGTVMSKVIFGVSGTTGIILLPVLLYHAMQLIITGVLSRRFSKLKYPE